MSARFWGDAGVTLCGAKPPTRNKPVEATAQWTYDLGLHAMRVTPPRGVSTAGNERAGVIP